MEWVKSLTGYYRALDEVSDGAEVMFTRGIALVGEMETAGFIHTSVLHWLTRRPRMATEYAAELVGAGLWSTTDDGFQVVHWELYAAPRKRAHISLEVRLAVYERDGWACLHCSAAEPLSLDHIWPWSLGGSDRAENLQTLCLPCNMLKGARV